MAKTPSPVAGAMKYLKDNEIKYVDLRFTDPRGKMQHVTQDISTIDEDVWADG
ncbi:MAG: glutamine synthetase, partial [Anderseniella sp.]|nr:glutamine synthetase [Anderseniella sp.]